MTDKYDYNRFGRKGKRVGQAVMDILSRENNPIVTAEEITEERQQQYLKDLKEAADLGKKEFESPFYVVYLFNKEHWSTIVGRGRFVRRQTEPTPENMMTLFPYYVKDVWKIDAPKGSIDYLWTLPSLENFNQILNHKDQYSESLCKWTKDPLSEKESFNQSDQS